MSRHKNKNISKDILVGLFGLAKDLTLAAVDPYGRFHSEFSLRTLGSSSTNVPSSKSYFKEYSKGQVYSAVRTLKKQGLIVANTTDGKTLYQLTENGALVVKKEQILEKLQTKKMDGKWRVVIFDIPESERYLRDNFRNLLRELNFKLLQASVWASPYDVFDELEELVPDIAA